MTKCRAGGGADKIGYNDAIVIAGTPLEPLYITKLLSAFLTPKVSPCTFLSPTCRMKVSMLVWWGHIMPDSERAPFSVSVVTHNRLMYVP